MKNLLYILLIISVVCMPVMVRADETPQPEETAAGMGTDAGAEQPAEAAGEDTYSPDEVAAWDEEVAGLPPMHYILEPEVKTWLGASIVSVSGSNRALEYGWPESSPSGGFKLHFSPLPHRVDAELEYINPHDYLAEFGYAYKDVFKVNYVGNGLWHNLDHYKPVTAYTERDVDEEYHVGVNDNRLFLRLKWPDRAYHLFGELRQFSKDGFVQQRYQAGNAAKFSQTRKNEWTTRQARLGVNGHFGPIEAEYSHRLKRFTSGADFKMADTFTKRPAPNSNYYSEHSVVPDIITNEDTIKVHTDLTGRIVGSATFVNGTKDNRRNEANVGYKRANADMTFIPCQGVTMSVRYRYQELQVDNPDFIFDANFPVVKLRPTFDSMDTRTNRAEAAIRYSPTNSFATSLEYLFEKKERYNTKEWSTELHYMTMPSEENQHTVKLGVDVRPSRKLKARGTVQYLYDSDPAYPTKPKTQFSGRLDVDWMPSASVIADFYYRVAVGENNTNADMRFSRNNVGTLVSWTPADRLTTHVSYDYTRMFRDPNIAWSMGGGLTLDERVPYTDSSHVYSLGADYEFVAPLSVGAEFHQAWTRSRFRTSVYRTATGLSTSYIGPLTNLKVRETGGEVSARYTCRNSGWGTEVSYRINDYEDMQDQPQDGEQDGTAHTVLVYLTKKW